MRTPRKVISISLVLALTLLASACNKNGGTSTSSTVSPTTTSSSAQGETTAESTTTTSTDETVGSSETASVGEEDTQTTAEPGDSLETTTSRTTTTTRREYYDGSAGPVDDFTLKGAYVGWQFKDTQGWVSPTSAKLSVENEQLVVEQTSEDPAVQTPTGLKIPADAIRTVEFRLKSTKADSVKLYWKRSGGSFSEACSVSIPLENDGQMHDYQIDLSRKEEWGGKVDQLRFEFVNGAGGTVSIQYCKTTGVYVAPFVVLKGNMADDLKMLNEMKATYQSQNKTAVIGFSYVLEYLAHGDYTGNYEVSSLLSNPNYLAQLCELTGMPMVLWLRGDPWGGLGGPDSAGQYLLKDDEAVMWTQNTTGQYAYHNHKTGFVYFSLAPTDLEGNKTEYWTLTEQLLGKVAAMVDELIQEKPGYVLGVTLTSELKYNTEDTSEILDYNPRTILDFQKWCKEKYATIQALNAAMGTSFTTYDMRSTDYDPSTVENEGGFDAPRDRSNQTFFNLWVTYREELVQRTVQRMADICAEQLDTKYIYTHQICYEQGDNTTIPNICSPIESGYATNANMGIDMFTADFNQSNYSRITKMLADDYTKSWGIPEWLHQSASPSVTFDGLKLAHANGIKFLSPFAWGATSYGAEGIPLEFKDSDPTKGIQMYLSYLDAMAN